MHDNFDGVIVNELRRFEDALSEILRSLQGKSTLTVSGRSSLREMYTRVKSELKVANKSGTVGGARRQQYESEAQYFAPAVRHTLIELRASTNSNPISSRWLALISEAMREISYYLYKMEKDISRGVKL